MKRRTNKNEKEIVLARVRAYTEDFELSIGGKGTFSRDEIVENIEKETDVGREIVEMQMDYLRDLISGNIYKILED